MLLRSALNHRIQFACVYKSCIFLALSSVSCILALIFFNAICLCQLHWKRKTCLPILCLSLLHSSLHCTSLSFGLHQFRSRAEVIELCLKLAIRRRRNKNRKFNRQQSHFNFFLFFFPFIFWFCFFSIWISYWPISVRPKLLPLLKTGSRVICNTFFARIFRANCNYS